MVGLVLMTRSGAGLLLVSVLVDGVKADSSSSSDCRQRRECDSQAAAYQSSAVSMDSMPG